MPSPRWSAPRTRRGRRGAARSRRHGRAEERLPGGEKEYANTRRQELLKQREVKTSATNRALGPEDNADVLRPLARASRRARCAEHQLDVIVTDGTYFKQRIEQLAAPRRGYAGRSGARCAARSGAPNHRARGKPAGAGERAARAMKERAVSPNARRDRAACRGARRGLRRAHNAVRSELARLEPVALQARPCRRAPIARGAGQRSGARRERLSARRSTSSSSRTR